MLAAAIVLFLGNSVFAWRDGWSNAGEATRAGTVGMTLLLAGVLTLLLVLAVGKRIGVALWMLVAVIAIAAVATVYRAMLGELPTGAAGIVAVANAGLGLVGVGLLLVGRGAAAWFREGRIR